MKKAFLLVLLIFINCNSKELTTYEKMESDKLMSEFFTNSELKDLAKIVDFFEEQMSDKYKSSDKESLSSIYKKFNVADSIEYRDNFSYLLFIDYVKQKELYNKLDSSLVYKIWQHPLSLKDNKPIKSKYFIKCFGDFIEFLKLADNPDSKIKLFKSYAESTETSCGISIQNTIDLSLNYRFYNLKDVKTRLLFAIHYLSSNEELIQSQLNK